MDIKIDLWIDHGVKVFVKYGTNFSQRLTDQVICFSIFENTVPVLEEVT